MVTADHGESFGEHYFISHGSHLYEDNVRVPLLVREPGQTDGRRVKHAVQNHRIFASVLAAAGTNLNPALPAGSLLGSHEPIIVEVKRSDSNIRLFGEFFARDLRAILDPPYKLVLSSRGGRELFDVERDPGELGDLARAQPERVDALSSTFDRLASERPPLYDEANRATLRKETEEALRALGYLD